MISMRMSLEHMAWSTQGFLRQVTALPDEVHGLRAAPGEWTVGTLLTHLARSAEWYRYVLSGAQWSDLEPTTCRADVLALGEYLSALDDFLVAQSELADEVVEFKDENGPARAARGMILAQAVMHAAEHKGQIAAIVKANGHHLDLDQLDVWAFVAR